MPFDSMKNLLILAGLFLCVETRAPVIIYNDSVFYIQPGVTVQGGAIVSVSGGTVGALLNEDSTELQNENSTVLLNEI
jgi:hypothetical protein